jgi:uncharacterized protein (UPF0262 family)
MSYISHIELDDKHSPPPTAEIQKERQVALYDLLEGNKFEVPSKSGPYHLILSIKEKRLVFEVTKEDQSPVSEFHLSLSPFRQVVKDYWAICESYYDAVKNLPPGKIETIDMARRGIHDEGARILLERLEEKAILDRDTSRRLFTLICILHFGI